MSFHKNDKRRAEIFEALCNYALVHNGNSPSVRDLLTELHNLGYEIGHGTLTHYLGTLENQGMLERRDGKLIIINSEWIPPD